MTGRLLVSLALLAACGSSPPSGPPPQPQPESEPAPPPKVLAPPKVAEVPPGEEENVETISGTIASIRLENINKALDHYTYNVELVVERTDADPISVRVDKIFWSETRQAVRDAIAPDGPKQQLSPKAWRDWTVGDTVQLRVRVTSPGLALLVK